MISDSKNQSLSDNIVNNNNFIKLLIEKNYIVYIFQFLKLKLLLLSNDLDLNFLVHIERLNMLYPDPDRF